VDQSLTEAESVEREQVTLRLRGGGETHNVSAIAWNVQGIKNKEYDFWDFINNYDIVLLCETWLESKDESVMMKKMSGDYKWFWEPAVRTSTRGRASGGFLVGIGKNIFERVGVSPIKHGMLVEVEGKREESFCIFFCYRQASMQKIKADWTGLVMEKIEEGYEIVMVGDWNARVGGLGGEVDESWEILDVDSRGLADRSSKDARINRDGMTLMKWMTEMGFTILNGRTEDDKEGEWTHTDYRGNSVIDLAFEMRNRRLIENLRVEPRCESDHMPIVLIFDRVKNCNLSNKTENHVREVRKIMRWKKDKAIVFQEELRNLDNRVEMRIESMEEITDRVKQAMMRSEMYKLTGSGVPNQVRNPWFDKECRAAKRRLNKACREIRCNNNHSEEYLNKKREFKKLIANKKKEYKRSVWTTIDYNKDPKQFWESFNRLGGRSKERGMGLDRSKWADYLAGQMGERSTRAGENITEEDQVSVLEEELDNEFSMEELSRALCSYNKERAPGEDEIPGRAWYHLDDNHKNVLLGIYNTWWRQEKIERDVNRAVMIPIFKREIRAGWRITEALRC
jgi:hypothetical protein